MKKYKLQTNIISRFINIFIDITEISHNYDREINKIGSKKRHFYPQIQYSACFAICGMKCRLISVDGASINRYNLYSVF